MAIKGIVTKAKDKPTPELPQTIEAANKLWEEWFVVEKVMNDGTLAPTKLAFATNDEYLNWIIEGGPDRDLKDPNGEYKVVRSWRRRR
jgi:hypothetical protein